jgi:hypothetical protein
MTRIDVLPGLLITFLFLALTSTCKPFCTEGLSRLHSLTLVAQFISLFGGLVLIIEDYISAQLAVANESDNTSYKTSVIYVLVYLCNGAVAGWPAIQLLLLKSPFEIVEIIQANIKGPTSCTDALIAIASEDNDALIDIVGNDRDDSCCNGDGSNDGNISSNGDGDGGGDDNDGRVGPPAQFEDNAPPALTTLPTGAGVVPIALYGLTPSVQVGSASCFANADFISLSWSRGEHEGETVLPVVAAPALLAVGAATLESTPNAQTDLQAASDLAFMPQADSTQQVPNRHFYGMPPPYRWLIDSRPPP